MRRSRARTGQQLGLALEGAAPSRPDGPAPSLALSDEGKPGGPPLPDAAARARIARDLESNLLVEAGAGSGKTTELVGRMVALVRTGSASVHEIAAVTFTRKAAGELRQRFQETLENACGNDGCTSAERERLDRALQEVDRAFMGTIHAFCARLLREHPLEARLDPAFVETTAPQAIAEAARFWSLYLERLASVGDPILRELQELGMTPTELRGLYDELRDYPDLELPLEATPPPDSAVVAAARVELEALVREAERLLPSAEPAAGWDTLQSRVRTLLYRMRHGPWQDDRYFLDTVGDMISGWDLVQSRWASDKRGKEAAKRLCARFAALGEEGSATMRLLDQWWAHRYPTALRFARGAADGLRAHRRATGRLDFQDLLSLAARLLRESPSARAELGRRWRRFLVDEFQDTDPLQAEVLFLLASDPSEGADWARVVPRPGALFVVGDPKQSIYRFRRADIALYTRVRARFETFGAALALTANFRSGPPIAALVNEVFAPPDGFPTTGNETQPGFASLDSQPRRDDPPREGVFSFTVTPEGKVTQDALADWEAEAVAEWVAGRIRHGERAASDFLILTRKKEPLARLARALEARALPVQVSGVFMGVEEEIAELTQLLRALSDPSDATLTVAVLIGLFFGLDHEQLLVHHEAQRGFDLRYANPSPDADTAPVEAALCRLRTWWELAREQPADVVVNRIADDVALLPWAAAGELGSIRAGALAFALDAVRRAGLDGDTSLGEAVEALGAALAEEEAEAPLEPGRRSAVRLMNLHKAKGLEAPVVLLAAPWGKPDHPIRRHVERTPDGRARGWLLVEQKEGRGTRTIARPRGWSEKEARERTFEEAEELRLLYVAVTRAEHELVVSRPPKHPERSAWGRLDNWLERSSEHMELCPVAPSPRARLEDPTAALPAAARDRDRARAEAAVPTFRFTTVTALVKESAGGEGSAAPDLPPLLPSSTGPGGYEWGTAVHTLLQATARGATGDRMQALGRVLLLELDRPARAGEPTELDALIRTVEGVRESSIWRRAQASELRVAEVPFALQVGEAAAYLEGVIDLAFREADGWVLADYKSDRGDDPELASRRLRYREQIRRYGEAWSRLTGEPVKERVILWTRTGTEERVEP